MECSCGLSSYQPVRGVALTILTKLAGSSYLQMCTLNLGASALYTRLNSTEINLLGTAWEEERAYTRIGRRHQISFSIGILYPNVESRMVDVLAKDQFIDTIAAEDISYAYLTGQNSLVNFIIWTLSHSSGHAPEWQTTWLTTCTWLLPLSRKHIAK